MLYAVNLKTLYYWIWNFIQTYYKLYTKNFRSSCYNLLSKKLSVGKSETSYK